MYILLYYLGTVYSMVLFFFYSISYWIAHVYERALELCIFSRFAIRPYQSKDLHQERCQGRKPSLPEVYADAQLALFREG